MSFWQIQNEAFFGLFILELNLFFLVNLCTHLKSMLKKMSFYFLWFVFYYIQVTPPSISFPSSSQVLERNKFFLFTVRCKSCSVLFAMHIPV